MGQDEFNDLSDQGIVTKFMGAAEICNTALKMALDRCVVDADVAVICKDIDTYMETECQKLYSKKQKNGEPVKRGVAMPCCIAINEVIGHFSPVEEGTKIKDGDVVSVDLGCHLDGYIAQAAHTKLVGDGGDTGRKADVIQAAWKCAEAAVRMIKPGDSSEELTRIFGLISDDFECKPILGAQSRQMKQHVIDGNKAIMMAPAGEDEEGEEDFDFKEGDVFAIDIMMSTGDGKFREMDAKTTVHKRDVEVKYALKTQLARRFLGQVSKKHPTLPFHLRDMLAEDPNMVNIGVKESVRWELLEPYVPMTEKKNEFVAQFKFTICLFPAGPKKITGLTFDQNNILKSDKCVKNEDVLEILKRPQPGAKKKKNKKK